MIVALFLAMFYLPVGVPRFDGAVLESFHLVKWPLTAAAAALVVVMATVTGLIYGSVVS